ncbi:MAG: dTDP-4-dehydrorhamnose 3,5-epimerase [Candidatus Sumerlaeota bacterium]|nr:dTDP-4-dehydrorhamnose 3,5-epimerase [Candidatus Sumerlaeota bacterium]
MRVIKTKIANLLLIEPDVYYDQRGFFLEFFNANKYRVAGIPENFVQDNHSRSVGRTLRGLHLQREHPQAKLVRVIEGEIYDVAVDLRRGSHTFGQWVGLYLSAANFHQTYIPAGFAHGFCVMSPEAQIEYKCADFYDPKDEMAIRWDDPDIAIHWPISDPILSPKDEAALSLKDALERLPKEGAYTANIQ